MKPDTATAMQNLIRDVRATFPFGASEAQLCSDSDSCQGCSKKLLEFIDTELDDWEHKLQQGVRPNFGDINRMGKTCKKVYTILKKNGLVNEPSTDSD